MRNVKAMYRKGNILARTISEFGCRPTLFYSLDQQVSPRALPWVHRQRPFLDGRFVDWSGYSFASGHTIGTTLLYGTLLLFVLPALKSRHWRLLSILSAISLVTLVGFSRIALGAHFLTDVLAAILFGIVWLMFCLFLTKPMRRRVVSTAAVPLVGEPALVRVELAE